MAATPRDGDGDGAGLQVRRHGDGGHVVEIMLDRPEARNAISSELAARLAAATAAVSADATVRAVVLSSSSDRAFCAGADLRERSGMSAAELAAYRGVSREAYRGVVRLPVPAVAAVAGYALGGGLELALCCDLIVADDTAVIGLPEVSVGIVPGGGATQLLARRVGWSRAADLTFTARRLDAAEASRLGLLDRLVPGGTVRQAALDLAGAIAANSPVAVRNAKQAMRLGLDVPLQVGLEVEDAAWQVAASSPDRIEGLKAFTARRPPRWA